MCTHDCVTVPTVSVCMSNQIKSLAIRYHHPASPVKQYHWSALDQTSVCVQACAYFCVCVDSNQIKQMNDELRTTDSRFIPGCQAGKITTLQLICLYLCVMLYECVVSLFLSLILFTFSFSPLSMPPMTASAGHTLRQLASTAWVRW